MVRKLFGSDVADHSYAWTRIKLDYIKDERQPCLAIVTAGDDPASAVYVRKKILACDKVGIVWNHIVCPAEDASNETLIECIERLNSNDNVDGIIVQLPLPKNCDEDVVLSHISPYKDVDGLTRNGSDFFTPCTPKAVMEILNYYDIPVKGKHVVIVGRSKLVGKPLAKLMLDSDATVTVCHSKTEDLKSITSTADILVVAIGKPNFISPDYVKEGAVVIDVGINRTIDGIRGDVYHDGVESKCSCITPVPGGVGPVTVAMLIENTMEAWRLRRELNEQ